MVGCAVSSRVAGMHANYFDGWALSTTAVPVCCHRYVRRDYSLLERVGHIVCSMSDHAEQDRSTRTAAPRFGFERAVSSDAGFAAGARLQRRSVSSGRSANKSYEMFPLPH